MAKAIRRLAMERLTSGASTKDWLIASKNMKINAFVETEFSLTPQTAEEHKLPITESIFGANIKDAIRVTREWLDSRD
jgi:hypothetical protein